MLRLPLTSGNEVSIFGTNLAVSKVFERRYPNTNNGGIETFEIVKVQDGNHNNGGWETTMSYEQVLLAVKMHLEEMKNA